MRKFKLLTLLAATLMTANMWAQGPWTSGSCTVTLSGSTMTVTGSGAMANYTLASQQPWKSNRSGVTTIVIDAGVTAVGRNCFASFSDLTTVEVGADVTSFGNTAFKDCSNLTSITFSATTPATFGTNVFQNTSASLKYYVPDANAQAYSNAWLALEGKIYCATSGDPAPAPHGEGDFGYEGDNLSWDYTDGILTITGSGDMEDFAAVADVPWNAFMKSITTINFPGGLISIGENAFNGATALTAINLPNGLEAIGSKAFNNCNNAALTSITFPASIESIDKDAFYGCTKVTDIYMSGNPADLYWDDDACDDFIKSPKKTTRCHVPAAYFAGYVTKNTGSTSGSGATDIDVTFVMDPAYTSGACTLILSSQGAGCETTMAITGNGAMADYNDAASQPWADYTSGITKITIDENVTRIGHHAFDGCEQLVVIDAKPTTPPALGTDAFKDFNSGLQVSYPCMSYESYFDVWSIFDGKFGDCAAPDNSCGSGLIWDVTANVLSITKAYPGTGVMNNYSGGSTNAAPWKSVASTLTSIEIGNGVTTIGNYAFYQCTNASLTAITIPATVTSIGTFSFSTTKITEVTIPANVASIGDYAFSNCYDLTTVNMLPTTAPTPGGTNMFSYSTNVTTINYPCGSSESYEDVWSDYASLLTENCGGPVGPQVDDITANGDPEHPGVYYSTYYSNKTMALPNNGTEAYVATLSGGEMLLTKIAEGAQVLPANTAVILRGPSASFDMTESEETPVSFSATNNLKGSMLATTTANNLYQQYYVLSGHSSDNEVQGVGFYKYDGSIPAQKAYLIILSNGNAAAPKRVRFIFEEEQQATGIENVQDNVQATKLIENGMLIIEKNGVRYNAQGQIVK